MTLLSESYQLTELLTNRLQELQQLEQRLLLRLQTAPEGSLQIRKDKKKIKYYLYSNQSEGSFSYGKYIKKSQTQLIHSLAQKEYDTVLLKQIAIQKKAIQVFLSTFQPDALSNVYASLSQTRKQILLSKIPDNDTFIKDWESVVYTPGKFEPGTPYYNTLKGEYVRSKSEKIIADTLYSKNIPYRYEYPLTLNNGKIWRPDFTILNRRTLTEYILEHFGMMEDIDYCNNALNKIRIYIQNGFYPGENLLITAETRSLPFSTAELDQLIKHYLI